MGKIIGVISLKGGVGKTSSVVALGAALAEFGKKVLLIDGNFSSPTLGLHVNIIEPETTLHHVLNSSAHAKDAIYRPEKADFDIMPASIFNNFNISPLKLKDKIKGLKRRYDMILVDSSPSLDNETLAVMLASDELIVVTTPDRPTLSSTIKAVKMAKKRGTPISGIIINKSHGKHFEISLKDIEETLEIPVLAVIPHDINVLKALSDMEPSTSHKPKSKGSQEYKKLAAVLVGEKYRQSKLKDFFRKITPSRQEINRELFYKRVFKK